ncbi:MAG: hypothetical protein ACFFBD_10110 [Candidatus Hodarchaeota archaeon]
MIAASPVPKRITTGDRVVIEFMEKRQKIIAARKEQRKYQINPYRPAWKVIENGAWKDERCFIIGGGPSLTGFDFERLRDKGKIIAVNKAFYDCMFADICYFMDSSSTTFYGLVKNGRLGPDYKKAWGEFKGLKIHCNRMGRKLEDTYSIRHLEQYGVSRSLKQGMLFTNNSGAGALHLAIMLKANPIFLLGIDGKFTKGKSHYHEGYPSKHSESLYKSFVKEFEFIGRAIYKSRYKIYNLNPNSAVRCFPFKKIDEVLA